MTTDERQDNPFPKYTHRPGGAEYKTVHSIAEAEHLHTHGWAMMPGTGVFDRWQFWRPKNPDER